MDSDNYTNTIEGFWAQLKRMIFGIYHSVSSKYLQRYVDEAVFRYNTRKQSESDRFKYMFLKSIGVVQYRDILNVVWTLFEESIGVFIKESPHTLLVWLAVCEETVI